MRTLLEILSSSRGTQHTTPVTKDLQFWFAILDFEVLKIEIRLRDHILAPLLEILVSVIQYFPLGER